MEAECFQHFHRRDPDVRLIVTDECVVPKDDFTVAAVYARRPIISAVTDRRYRYGVIREPSIKPFIRVLR